MSYIELLNSVNSSKTLDLAVNRIESPEASNMLFQESSSSPAISLFAWSPATTISGRRLTFLNPASFTFVDYHIASGVFRLTLYSTDECVCETKLVHLSLHLIVSYICCMGSSVSHEYECCSILCSSFHAVISGRFYCLICDCLSNSSLVLLITVASSPTSPSIGSAIATDSNLSLYSLIASTISSYSAPCIRCVG